MPAHLIHDYGYLAVALITFLEGESIVILAGIAVGAGQLVFGEVVLYAVLGSVAGDQLWFHIGRRWGPRVAAWRPSWSIPAERILARLRARETFVMLTFRFYYGLRALTPFVIGAARVPPLRFLRLNFIGAVIWATTFTFGGYMLGDALMRQFDAISGWGTLAVLGAFLVAVALAHLLSTRIVRRG
jgi:membrane protein DedA with SNARE-associated domain